jgi:hypothetical protein
MLGAFVRRATSVTPWRSVFGASAVARVPMAAVVSGPALRWFAASAADAAKQKKAEKKAAKGIKVEVGTGDAVLDGFNVPLVVAKEPAVAVFDLESPSQSVVVPADKLHFKSFGLQFHESLTGSRGLGKRPVVYVPFPSAKAGDVHVFSEFSGGSWVAAVASNVAGVADKDRLLPVTNSDVHITPHAFNKAFLAAYHVGHQSPSPLMAWSGPTTILQEVLKYVSAQGPVAAAGMSSTRPRGAAQVFALVV